MAICYHKLAQRCKNTSPGIFFVFEIFDCCPKLWLIESLLTLGMMVDLQHEESMIRIQCHLVIFEDTLEYLTAHFKKIMIDRLRSLTSVIFWYPI